MLGDANTEAVKAALAAIPHREGVILAGGEVTLRPDLPALVQAARALGFKRVALQTNGHILASKGAASGLRSLGLTDVAVAIHAPDAETHDWLTGVEGSFRRAAAAARQAHASGLTLYLSVVLTRTTTQLAARMVLLARSLGAGTIRFTPCREEGAAIAEARMLAPRLSLVAEALVAAAEVGRDAGVVVEVVGVPLCLAPELRALAADRLDGRSPDRVSAIGEGEQREARAYGDDCVRCTLRSVCPGVEAAYLRRWGGDELAAVGVSARVTPEIVEVVVEPGETGRALKQRLVKAQATGAAGVRFVGGAASTHPELGALRQECERLGLGLR